MKKIPTLFERVFENHRVVGITEKVTPGMEWVLNGEWLPQKLLGEDAVDCSECKTIGSPQWKWCPVCGAKMDGKDGAE